MPRLQPPASHVGGTWVADFDDDGHVDVVVLRSLGSNYKQWLDVYRGDGAGGFILALTVESHQNPGDLGVPWVPKFICDYNGDGLPDLGTHTQGEYAFFLNTSE